MKSAQILPSNRKTWLWMGIYVLGVSLAIYSLLWFWAYDDPFITYRYAHNLAHGLGFVYNPGEHVLSTTTPLFALLLAPFAAWEFDLHLVANLISAISMAMGAIFLWDLSRRWRTPGVGWAGLVLYPCFPLVLSTIGSETPLYLALCLAAFALYARRRYLFTGLVCALVTLTRPDGILVPAILAAHFALNQCVNVQTFKRANVMAAIVIFAAILLAWAIPAWLYFGSPIPVTLAAKQSQGAMQISQKFAAGLLDMLQYYRSWPYLLEAAIASLGVIWSCWKKRSWLLYIAWPVLYFAAYAWLGVSRYFWYYAPLAPGFIVLVGLGLDMISGFRASTGPAEGLKIAGRPANSQSVGNVSTSSRRRLRTGASTFNLPRFIAALLLLILCVAQSRQVWVMRNEQDMRYAIYRVAGEWLAQNTPPEARVGMLEVGMLGYYAQRPVVDFAGLIQPDVARQMQATSTYEDTAFWAASHFQPEYIVLFLGSLPRFEQEFVSVYCQPRNMFRASEYKGPLDLIIYQCREVSR